MNEQGEANLAASIWPERAGLLHPSAKSAEKGTIIGKQLMGSAKWGSGKKATKRQKRANSIKNVTDWSRQKRAKKVVK